MQDFRRGGAGHVSLFRQYRSCLLIEDSAMVSVSTISLTAALKRQANLPFWMDFPQTRHVEPCAAVRLCELRVKGIMEPL